MKITRRSPVSGEINTMEIDVTEEVLDEWKLGYDLIQNLMPNLTATEREFIATGITGKEWDNIFKDEK